jgi:endoribonuclease Dicer
LEVRYKKRSSKDNLSSNDLIFPTCIISTIEQNLDAVVRSTRFNREELAQFVHRPVFKHIQYTLPDYFFQNGDNGSFPFTSQLPSHNFTSLQAVVNQLYIEDDPYIKALRKMVSGLSPGPQRHMVDQKLSKVLQRGDTLTHRGLRDFLTSASAICTDLGPWAADWYVQKVLEQARAAGRSFQFVVKNWEPSERQYILDTLAKVDVIPVSYDPAVVSRGVTNRVMSLIEAIMNEKLDFESHDESFSGIVFVTRRDVCIALAEVLRHHPFTCDNFQIGCLLGTSGDARRTSFLDITRNLIDQPQAEILSDFKIGAKNLIISTSVAEEGIDVQACCSVIRWDPPPNMISWAQSRGRARKKRSSFIVMTVAGDPPSVHKWEELEAEMVALYNNPARIAQYPQDEDENASDLENYMELTVPETGCVPPDIWE